MNISPLISICVPVYGVENYIEHCARSLFEQTYADIEFVFVDDCSPDNSMEVVTQLLNEYPKRAKAVKIVKHESNRGLAAARNTSINHASGEFILWVDADDSVDTHLVEKLLMKQRETNADVVCYDIQIKYHDHVDFFINGDYQDGKVFLKKMLLCEAPHQQWGHLIRKRILDCYNIKCVEGINQSEDLQMMIQVAYYANIVATLHEVLYFYDRSRENSYSNNITCESLNQISRTYDIIESFLLNHNEWDLVDVMRKGQVINLCRKKMLVCDHEDKDMYIKICEIINIYYPKLKQPVAFKYKLLSIVKPYSIFKLLISIRKYMR